MAINKVIYDGNTLVDLTDSTITEEDVERGKIFYDASGTQQIGVAKALIFSDFIDASYDNLTVLYENKDLVFTGNNYIDTDVALFSSENISKDFCIILEGLTVDNTKGSGSAGERCLLGAMYEVSPYPGFIIRATTNAGGGVVGIVNQTYVPLLVIRRINGQMIFSTASITTGTVTAPTGNTNMGGAVVRVGNMNNCATAHNTTLTLGCEKDKNGTPYRYCGGSIEKIIIAMAT